VRPSGTEPLLRIMIEGEDATAIARMADELALIVAANGEAPKKASA
jgi:phosphomannomutase